MSRLGRFIDSFEENAIASILALMTLVAFTQVVARYAFNSGWGGALEFTRVLFAWLILFGMSYGLKISAHLGVDAFIRLFPKPMFKFFALTGAAATVLYAVLLLDATWFGYLLGLENRGASGGALTYWQKFYKIGIGMEDLVFPEWFQETFGTQDRVPRWIPYLILPVGLVLLGFRAVQMFWLIWIGDKEIMIAAHEAEELVAENKDVLKD